MEILTCFFVVFFVVQQHFLFEFLQCFIRMQSSKFVVKVCKRIYFYLSVIAVVFCVNIIICSVIKWEIKGPFPPLHLSNHFRLLYNCLFVIISNFYVIIVSYNRLCHNFNYEFYVINLTFYFIDLKMSNFYVKIMTWHIILSTFSIIIVTFCVLIIIMIFFLCDGNGLSYIVVYLDVIL